MDQAQDGRKRESLPPSLPPSMEAPEVRIASEAVAAWKTAERSSTFDAVRAFKSSIDLPAFKGLRAVVSAMNLVNESPAMGAMRALQNSPVFSVARQLRDSPAFQLTNMLQDSPVLDLARMLKDSPALTVSRSFPALPAWETLRKFEESPAFTAMRALQRPAAFQAMQTFASLNSNALKGIWDPGDLRFADEELLRDIATARDSDLEALIRHADRALTGLDDVSKGDVNDEAAIADEIRGALLDFEKAKTLSATALGYFIKLLVVLCAVYQGIAQWPDFQAGVCDLQARLLTVEASRELRRVTKGLVCGIPRELLKGMRYTDRTNTPLHARPAIRSEVLEVLPKGAVLIVLDDSDRNWLLVRFSHEGVESDGWVSRKFVRRFLQ